MICSKYKCENDTLPVIDSRRSESNLWRGIVNGWDSLKTNLKWKVGNGMATKLWKNWWILKNFKSKDKVYIY